MAWCVRPALVIVAAASLLTACQAGSTPLGSGVALPIDSRQPSVTDQPEAHPSAVTGATSPDDSAEPSIAPAPLSRDRAVAIARVLGVHTTTSSLIGATAGPFGDFDTAPNGKVTEPRDALVWDVKFRLSNGTAAFVILDYYTGVLVETGLAKQ